MTAEREFLFGVACMAVLTCASGCSSSRQTPAAKPIEPMAVGNTWTYRITEADGTSRRIRRTITEIRDINGERGFHYAVTNLDNGSDFGGYDQILRDDGIYAFFEFDDSAVKQVPLSPKVGDSWTSKAGGFAETYTVTATDEQVTTPAGTFPCTVVVNELTDDEGPHKAIFHFARGVGLVRTLYDDGVDEQLAEYKLVD